MGPSLFTDATPWHGRLIGYLFLVGVATGAYALACLAALFGTEADRRASRGVHGLVFPLALVCAGFLLGEWSSAGRAARARVVASAEGLATFSAFALASLLGAVVEDHPSGFGVWSGRVSRCRRSWAGKIVSMAGGMSALGLGASTQLLRPSAWAGSPWLGAVFLASSLATGASALMLFNHWQTLREVDPDTNDHGEIDRLGPVFSLAILAELAALSGLALSLRGLDGMAFQAWPGRLIPLLVVPIGLVLPLVLHESKGRRGAVDVALLILLGGYVLRSAIVGIPDSLPFH